MQKKKIPESVKKIPESVKIPSKKALIILIILRQQKTALRRFCFLYTQNSVTTEESTAPGLLLLWPRHQRTGDNMTTFKEYLKKRHVSRAETEDLNNPVNLLIYEIINDENFPNDGDTPECYDGEMLHTYIMCMQPFSDDMEFNCAVDEAYSMLWKWYRRYLHETGELVSKYLIDYSRGNYD